MQTEKQRIWQEAKKKEMRLYLQVLKQAPCKDCGIEYPYYMMQFDHVRGEKVANIVTLLAARRYGAMMSELEKCEIVCANCHASRTWHRINSGL